jgi:hypothetical protein
MLQRFLGCWLLNVSDVVVLVEIKSGDERQVIKDLAGGSVNLFEVQWRIYWRD